MDSKYMQVTRYTAVLQPPNRAKYGANAPREGHINMWSERIYACSWDHEQDLLCEERAEEARAKRELKKWMEGK